MLPRYVLPTVRSRVAHVRRKLTAAWLGRLLGLIMPREGFSHRLLFAVFKLQLQSSIFFKSRFAGIFPDLFVIPGPTRVRS